MKVHMCYIIFRIRLFMFWETEICLLKYCSMGRKNKNLCVFNYNSCFGKKVIIKIVKHGMVIAHLVI